MPVKNPKVVLFSLIALMFLLLTFLVDWIFIIGAAILMTINQKEIMKNRNSKK